MTEEQLLSFLLDFLPDCEIGEDFDGQIVVYTNLRENENGILVPFEEGH